MSEKVVKMSRVTSPSAALPSVETVVLTCDDGDSATVKTSPKKGLRLWPQSEKRESR